MCCFLIGNLVNVTALPVMFFTNSRTWFIIVGWKWRDLIDIYDISEYLARFLRHSLSAYYAQYWIQATPVITSPQGTGEIGSF